MRRGLCTLYDQSPSALCLGNPVARDLHVVIGRVDARRPIMSVLTQSYQCCMWFVCSILRELAVSNLGQLLFCLSITWSRCRNAYRDLWIMTIKVPAYSTSPEELEHKACIACIYIHIHTHIYIYIQHAHAWMIAIIVEKSPNSSHIWLQFGLFFNNYIYICKIDILMNYS